MSDKLEWVNSKGFYGDVQYQEACLGDILLGDGVRFGLEKHPSLIRRGPYRLSIAINGRLWGPFDDDDQPIRWYHDEQRAKDEAQAIADVLVRGKRTPSCAVMQPEIYGESVVRNT